MTDVQSSLTSLTVRAPEGPNIVSSQPPNALEAWLANAAVNAFMCTTVVFWLTVLPLWFAHVLRTIASMSWQNVVSIHVRAQPIDVLRLERVVTYWPRGLMAILSTKDRPRGDGPDFEPKHGKALLIETGVALLFYAGLFVVIKFVVTVASSGFWLVSTGWQMLTWSIAATS